MVGNQYEQRNIKENEEVSAYRCHDYVDYRGGSPHLSAAFPSHHLDLVKLQACGLIRSRDHFPRELDFHAYEIVFTDTRMLWSMGLTIVLTVTYTVVSMVMSICAAYPLTKERLKGRKVFMLLIVFTMFFSGGLIPEYLLVKQLGLLDNLASLIVPGMISAFNLIILRSFSHRYLSAWKNQPTWTEVLT